MLKARYVKHRLQFRQASGTSRGILNYKDSWFLIVHKTNNPACVGIGECGLIPGLSPDPQHGFEHELSQLCQNINYAQNWIKTRGELFPSIRFGLETAFSDHENGGKRVFGETDFVIGKSGLPTHGLIWMGEADFIKEQIRKKIEDGFSCIKLKIGAIDFEQEIDIMHWIRIQWKDHNIEIRLDANGAFRPGDALEKLKRLSAFGIHSVEQPIKAGQTDAMAQICADSPIPIALDEELIGKKTDEIEALIQKLKPAYLILKPSLLGGLKVTTAIMKLASKHGASWILNSSLESNIGLNVLAQFAAKQGNPLIQGLGTGQLFTNNFDSPLELKNAQLYYNPAKSWQLNTILL
jgi:o-succinylbenzoate synthase